MFIPTINNGAGREQESDFLRRLFLNMPMGYFRLRIITDPDGLVTDYEYIDVNDKFLEIMGRPREYFVGRKHSDIGPIFVNKLDLQILARVAYHGYVHETKADRFRSNDRYYDTTIYSPRYGDVVALFADVTPAVQAAEQVRRSQQEFEKIYKNIPVGIEIYDRSGVMIGVNEQDAIILGVPDREILLGLSLFEHPSLPAHAREGLLAGHDVTFDVSLDGMKLNRQYYGVDNGGTLHYVTVKCTILRNAQGEPDGYMLIVIDNTTLYETTARLTEFESAFNTVAEIAEVGFFRWNPLKETYTNTDQFYRNMGMPYNSGDSVAFASYADLFHPDDLGQLNAFIADAIAGNAKNYSGDFRVKDGHGGWKWLHTSSHVTEWDPENDLVTITGINYNISDIKLAERKLIEAKEKAEASDRLKSSFLANMSHEIRTPLNSIVGFSSVIAQTDDPEERKMFAEIIETNNRHLLSLISDILDLSEIESEGGLELVMSDINVYNLCRQIVAVLQPQASEGVEVRYTGDEELKHTVIHSDLKRLTQVVNNLMANAMKFTHKGHVDLSFRLTEGAIEFNVRDTGIGMEPEQADAVFERFVKLNEFIPGTGLGLAVCKGIVEQMGGKIGAESKGKDQGSTFWFSIPV